MPVIHFLNVKEGDCSIIEQISGRTTVIDVSNATPPNVPAESFMKARAALERGINSNFNQKAYPENPISYMKDRNISSVFRFILTHPDCDHMDGIKAFFETFSPLNLWDTDNNAEKDFGDQQYSAFSEDDWKFYKKLRDGKPTTDPKRLTLYFSDRGQFFNLGENNSSGGDGLHILAPTKELVAAACEAEDYNESSYAILYLTGDRKILFAGDTHDAACGTHTVGSQSRRDGRGFADCTASRAGL